MERLQEPRAQRQPEWASLPAEVWQQVALCMADRHTRPSHHAGRTEEILSDLKVIHAATVLASVCTSLREAVWGSCAAALWAEIDVVLPSCSSPAHSDDPTRCPCRSRLTLLSRPLSSDTSCSPA